MLKLLKIPDWYVLLFFSHVEKHKNGCWIWKASASHGYGQVNGRPLVGKHSTLRAHRVSYVIHRGPIPDGMDIHHSCENKLCVNPEHLLPVTEAEHMGDLSPGSVAYENKHKTHCVHGHELSGENLYVKIPERPHWRFCAKCYYIKHGKSYAPKTKAWQIPKDPQERELRRSTLRRLVDLVGWSQCSHITSISKAHIHRTVRGVKPISDPLFDRIKAALAALDSTEVKL